MRTDKLGSPPIDTRVIEAHALAGRMRRIRVQGETLRAFSWVPGQQLRVQVNPLDAGAPVLRTYSIWDHDPEAATLDLVVFCHQGGPGSAWAEAAAPGDPVRMYGPLGMLVLYPRARYHLLLGDETAAVPMQAMLRSLPPDAPVIARFEATDAADFLPPVSDHPDVAWVLRDPDQPGGAALEATLADLDLPDKPGVAYLAGELGSCMRLRDHLLGRGWGRKDLRVKPFWAPDKEGLT